MKNKSGQNINKSFGKKIQYYRKLKGITQSDLRNAIGKTWETVSNIEHGLNSTKLESSTINQQHPFNLTPHFLLKYFSTSVISEQVGGCNNYKCRPALGIPLFSFQTNLFHKFYYLFDRH